MVRVAKKRTSTGHLKHVEEILHALPERVCARLKTTLQVMFPDSDFSEMRVHAMGSRWYGLHSDNSDFDLYVTVPVEVYIKIILSNIENSDLRVQS